jgi:hypothetical protein
MTLPVVVSPKAERQADAIDRWWRAHRSAAPDLFQGEFVAALDPPARAVKLVVSKNRYGESQKTIPLVFRADRGQLREQAAGRR